MKQKIKITRGDTLVYSGRVIELPAKDQEVINKSIELFDDEDPCIIHQSYVLKEFADTILTLLRKNKNQPIYGKDYADKLYFLDVREIEDIKIELVG